MIRAFTSTCLALLLLMGGKAFAGKPTIAVLGLEVRDDQGTPTAKDTQVAKEITEGLRLRAKAGTGQFQIAGNSDKELIDEKLLKGCDTEAPACMASIGGDLGADVLMYGRLEKQGKNYQVTMKLLDVKRKMVEKSSNTLIPVAQAEGAKLLTEATKIYATLTANSKGEIVVKVGNADRGTILVDGEEKGSFSNGTGTVSLDEGKYKIAVESQGFKRWEDTVTVKGGDATQVPVKLEKAETGTVVTPPGGGGIVTPPGGTPPGGEGPVGGGTTTTGSGAWKAVFVGSVVVGIGGGGIWLYGKHQIDGASTALTNGCGYGTCSDPTKALSPSDVKKYNDQGDKGRVFTIAGGVTVGVAGALALVAFYEGFIAKHDAGPSNEHAANGHRVRRDRFVVTPVVAPNGGGATLRFDW